LLRAKEPSGPEGASFSTGTEVRRATCFCTSVSAPLAWAVRQLGEGNGHGAVGYF